MTHGLDGCGKSWHLLELARIDELLGLGGGEAAKHAREERKEQAKHCTSTKRAVECLGVLLEEIGLGENLLQREHCKQRHGQLGNDEYARHGAELVVHGEMVDKQIGEPHHVVSPRQEY